MRHARLRPNRRRAAVTSFLAGLLAPLLALAALVPGAASANAPDDPCRNPPERMAVSRDRTGFGPWTHVLNIEHHRGLVFRDIRAGPWPFLKAFYISHFELTFDIDGRTKRRTVRYCSGDDQWRDSAWNDATSVYTWYYGHPIREDGIAGDFTVTYETKYGVLDKPCAGRGVTLGAFTRKCARWVPKMTYEWLPDPPRDGAPSATLKSVKAFYRLDYGEAAITLVSDPDTAGPAVLAAGVYPMVVTETSFLAVDGGGKGRYDNIHTAYPTDGRRTVVVPGCRAYGYDCTHLHWRWGGTTAPPLDPLEEPFTGRQVPGAKPGAAYLVPGQTIEIFVTGDNGEGDVADPRRLVNGEKLATAEVCEGSVKNALPDTYLRDVIRPVVLWYVAESKRPSDTFFRHGFFALEELHYFKDPARLSILIDNFYELNRQRCDPLIEPSGRTVRKAGP